MAIPAVAPEISALQLALALEWDRDLQIVDVRPPAAVAAGRIDMVPRERFHNIVGSDLLGRHTLEGTGIERARPIAVVCSRGQDSEIVAAHLNDLGCAARSLRGGMAAWMRLVLARTLVPPPALDSFVQFDRLGNGALGYLLVSSREALIVDPPRDAAAYLDAARGVNARVIGVADTHLHADYISGAPMLARKLGVPYYLHPYDAVSPYDGVPGTVEFRPIADGDVIKVGRCSVRVVHTPGHTEGSVCYLVSDTVALTGDFLFLTSIGRPDLVGKTAEWTAHLWNSLQSVKTAWRPELLVCPAHYGSADEGRMAGAVAAPFGRLLLENEALRFLHEAAFAEWVAARSGSFPDTYRRIKAVNLGLARADDQAADDLEFGRNRCALSE